MKDLAQRISYLQGLSEGMKVTESGPQGKMIVEMLEVLSQLANQMEEITENISDLQDYVESLDSDFCDLKSDFYDEEDEDDEFVEVKCKHCGEDVYFESDVLEDEDVIEIICPRCNEVVYVNDGSYDYEPAVIQPDIGASKMEQPRS
ncbi:MAG: CD1247 N-terminal domain-containing protein [Chitinophagales bacterium]